LCSNNLSTHTVSQFLIHSCTRARSFFFLCYIDSNVSSLRTEEHNHQRHYNNRIHLLNHLLTLLLLFLSFVLSSTRRLGALLIFTHDVTQISLSVLQIGVNTGGMKTWRRCGWAIYLGSILSFLYFRMYVFFFVIYRSVLFESSPWLNQLRVTTSSRFVLYVELMFHGLLAVLVVLNLIWAKRLFGLWKKWF